MEYSPQLVKIKEENIEQEEVNFDSLEEEDNFLINKVEEEDIGSNNTKEAEDGVEETKKEFICMKVEGYGIMEEVENNETKKDDQSKVDGNTDVDVIEETMMMDSTLIKTEVDYW